MLRLNIQKIAEKCNVENLYQLSRVLGWTAPTVYKYKDPKKVKAMFLNTLSDIVKEIATRKDIDPLNVKMGDLFDWKE